MEFDMTNKDHLKILQSRCEAAVVRMGVPYHKEDFFSYICLRFVANPNRSATIDQHLIDYLRSECGSESRSPARFAATYNQLNINLSSSSDDEDRAPRMELETATWDHNKDYSFELAANMLEGADRAMFLLHHEWGLQLKEIGNCFGVSESRICQKLTKIHKLLRRKGLRKAMDV